MQLETCPKCGATMQEVHKHLLVPEEPANTIKVIADVRALQECPHCSHIGELYSAGKLDMNRSDLPTQAAKGS